MFSKREVGLYAIGFVWASLALWPASFWYDAGDTYVKNFAQETNFEILYDGGPVREANIAYTVIIRKVPTQEIVSDITVGPFPYSPGAKRPDPLLISWWSGDPKALELKPGLYQMTTCWEIKRPFFGLVPNKDDCSVSNVFEVYSKDKNNGA